MTPEIDEANARHMLGDAIQQDGGLYKLGWYLAWSPGQIVAVLDGKFTADELEAIAFWMRGHK